MEENVMLDSLRDLVELSELPDSRKAFYRQSLDSIKTFMSMPLKDVAELLAISRQTMQKQEENILASGNPAAINDLAESKEFINDLFEEAEVASLKKVGAITSAEEASFVAARSLLTKLATPSTTAT